MVRVQRIEGSEIKRRQQAVLKVMEKEGVDCIIMHNFGNVFGGAFRYLTDSSHAYPMSAIMCKEGIAIFCHGPLMPDDEVPAFQGAVESLPVSQWTFPGLPPATFLNEGIPEVMLKFIKKHNFKKIGWVGLQFIPGNICLYLKDKLSNVDFVDISSQIDEIRRVKSPYEIERCMKAVALHDRLIAASAAMIKPGMTSYQLNIEIKKLGLDLGAIEFVTGLIAIARGDQIIGPSMAGDFPFKAGDYIWQLIEVAGAGGEWGECARIFCLGEEPNEKWIQAAKNLVYLQDTMAAACKPGALPQDIYRLGNKMLKEFGYVEEKRIFAHGQSYDIVDLPMFIEGETAPLLEHEFITIHPGMYPGPNHFNHTDNFIIEKDGARLLNKTPREIIPVAVY